MKSNEHIQLEIDDGLELRQRMAEKLLFFLNSAKRIKALEGKTVEEVLGTPEARCQFILHVAPDEYRELLDGINGILRNLEKEDWGMDGKTVVIGNPDNPQWDFPEHDDKSDLLDA